MAVRTVQQPPVDHLAWFHRIREAFARSPLFRDVTISEPFRGPAGTVSLGLGFGRGPSILQVAAETEEKAYAVLLKVAEAMVDVEQRCRVGLEASHRTEAEPVAETCGV